MPRVIACLLLLFFMPPLLAQNITLQWQSPTKPAGIISADSLTLQVYAKSLYELTGLKALYRDNELSLQYVSTTNSTSLWQGTISLRGYRDTVAVKIIATDFNNNKDSIASSVIYAPLPTITIANKQNISIANPTVKIKAYCTDSLYGCSVTINGQTFSDSAEVTLDLTAQQGTRICVPVTAQGKKYRQSSSTCVPVYVESNPYLKLIYGAEDRILDYNYNSVLTAKTARYVSDRGYSYDRYVDLNLVHLGDSSKEKIAFSGVIPTDLRQDAQWWEFFDYYKMPARITKYGVLFAGSDDLKALNPEYMYQWKDGSLTQVQPEKVDANSVFPVVSANGKYAIWTFYQQVASGQILGVTVRNLQTSTNQIFTFSGWINNIYADVSNEGKPYFISFNFDEAQNLTTIVDGKKTLLTNLKDLESVTRPLTDGRRTVYAKSNNFRYGQINQIILNDGVKDSIITDYGTVNPDIRDYYPPIYKYRINKDFLAYGKLNSTGTLQVFLMDSTGSAIQIGRFGTPSDVETLGTNGQVMFFNNGRRYLGDKSGNYRDVGSAKIGRSYFYDNKWYITTSNLLFQVKENIQPNTVTDLYRIPSKDSAYQFTLKDFESNFRGDGSLMGVKIVKLPSKGKLLLQGRSVVINEVINRLQISQLQYAANAALNQPDTIGWTGTNSIVLAENTAFVLLDKLRAPATPKISGLAAQYCKNAANSLIKIDNLPVTGIGTVAEVFLDGKTYPYQADSSLVLKISELEAGRHVLKLKYSNAIGADSIAPEFTIQPLETLKIQVAVSEPTISTAGTATVTANTLSGGGDKPTYSFASDRNFQNLFAQSGSGNKITIPATSLLTGVNWIYVQMKTSLSCTNVPAVIDSISLTVLDVATTISDIEFPDQKISVFPNPFRSKLKIDGLQTLKTYRVEIFSIDGRKLFTRDIRGIRSWEMENTAFNRKGQYVLKLYDTSRKRMLGTVMLLKE